jgi:hypothetical protein
MPAGLALVLAVLGHAAASGLICKPLRPGFVLRSVEATTGIEPVYAVLQTAPWPLGHVATDASGWLPREDSNLG